MTEKNIKFHTRYNMPEKSKQDLTRQTENIYTTIEPLAYNEETGEILNKSKQEKLIKTGEINIYKKIQSYKEDCELKHILENFAKTGDQSLINVKPASFLNTIGIPDNIHDFTKRTDEQMAIFNKFSPETQKKLKSQMTPDGLNALISDIVKQELIKRGYNLEKQSTKPEEKGAND